MKSINKENLLNINKGVILIKFWKVKTNITKCKKPKVKWLQEAMPKEFKYVQKM